ncbi:MAG: hypothetical protein HY717_20575 [Planctomycetes bacterium]|nr:hypothetical protein [Planctomycetota bacterium]
MDLPEPYPQFDRFQIRFRPVGERKSKFRIDDIAVDPDAPPPDPGRAGGEIAALAAEMRRARERRAPVILCHGAHLIKNGLAPLLIRLVEEGWLTHVATNGAGSIHDWEFAFLGRSTEDVRANVAVGEFGIWEETGAYLGLALLLGALEGIGYGEAVGKLIAEDRLSVPAREELRRRAQASVEGGASGQEGAAAALDLLFLMDQGKVQAGELAIPHPWKHRSIQARCYLKRVPFTVHPGIGQDIIYSHPLLAGGAVGQAALADFLIYAQAIRGLEGGVYLSVGSSVMSPMIFEKSLSMARNVLRQQGKTLEDFTIAVNDLAAVDWDWSKGEPPVDNPAYYVRFMKSFSRMGGKLSYMGLDNRVFLENLYCRLRA